MLLKSLDFEEACVEAVHSLEVDSILGEEGILHLRCDLTAHP